jgi:signal transduction histidine kinase
MRSHIKIIVFLILPVYSIAYQNPYWLEPNKEQIDSLSILFRNTSNDSVKLYLSRQLGLFYQEIDRNASIDYFSVTYNLSKKLNLDLWEAEASSRLGFQLAITGNFPESLQFLLNAQSITENPANEKNDWGLDKLAISGNTTIARLTILAVTHNHRGIMYNIMGNYNESISEYNLANKIAIELNDPALLSWIYMNFGENYKDKESFDSSLIFSERSLELADKSGFSKFRGYILSNTGLAYAGKKNYDKAKEYLNWSIQQNIALQNIQMLAWSHISMADILLETQSYDSVLYHARIAEKLFHKADAPNGLLQTYKIFSTFYQEMNIDSAFKYQGLAMETQENMRSAEKLRLFRNVSIDAQIKLEALEREKIKIENKIRVYSLLVTLSIFLLVSIILFRNNRQKLKANKILETTLDNLKATQAQLIQSEKMASLGELTAGIAHEIQNPLNFVNNFSEVNSELVEELMEEIKKGDMEEAQLIVKDILENEQKIKLHGQHASVIVKGMLEHSRASDGKKELTDINALADEYLRLAYHGFRAKDKSFNADFKTEFDESIPKISIIPQDIGRVLLNLINNAFYSVSEAQNNWAKETASAVKALPDRQSGSATEDSGYKPEVIISSKKHSNYIEICVKDNGFGIPAEIKNKIFQPFFTTKPTGQGTGLGLSLSYDIVKAHGGNLTLDKMKGGGVEFIIQLPLP